MILKAPKSFIKYVENSAHFLNCPTQKFNEDLNAVYRQFVLEKTVSEVSQHIANVLYTFGYSKKESLNIADKLYLFYSLTPYQEFLKLNVNSYKNNIPKRLIEKSNEISNTIKSRETFYWNGVRSSQGYYNFQKGYKLKTI